MKLYHGTDYQSAQKIFHSGVNLKHTVKDHDFGPGFYTCNDLDRAKEWAEYKGDKVCFRPSIVVFEFDETKAREFITYYENDEECSYFCVENRCLVIEHNNLISVGKIADRGITKFQKTWKDKQFIIERTKLPIFVGENDPVRQYVFHTEESLKLLNKSYIMCRTGEGKWTTI